jgi:hypothetical protein
MVTRCPPPEAPTGPVDEEGFDVSLLGKVNGLL